MACVMLTHNSNCDVGSCSQHNPGVRKREEVKVRHKHLLFFPLVVIQYGDVETLHWVGVGGKRDQVVPSLIILATYDCMHIQVFMSIELERALGGGAESCIVCMKTGL